MAAGATCPLCGRPIAGPTVDPGPDLGVCHRSCFVAWDRRCEAEERLQVEVLHLGAILPPAPRRRPSSEVRCG